MPFVVALAATVCRPSTPEGALKGSIVGDLDNYQVRWGTDWDWSPPGWVPSRNYIQKTGQSRFEWPKSATAPLPVHRREARRAS